MNKKEIILVIITLIIGVGGSAALVALTGGKADTKLQNTSETLDHSGEHDSSKQAPNVPEVDLTNQTSVNIDIAGYAYSKANIKIKKGTTVTWTNQDVVQHNVMKEHEDSDHAHNAPTADEVKPDVFAGPLLKKGESYSFTFNEVGANPYHCAPHPYMQGLVTVVE